ncbi:MAG: mercuric transporter MerT family protein [Hyphomicrobiales bacterium]
MPLNNKKTLSDTSTERMQKLLAAGGIAGGLAASSCCIVPLALFSLGVSGAWIGNLTRLAPYQPYLIAFALAFVGCGYWLVYRARKTACVEGAPCARPMPSRIVTTGLVVATVLTAGALAFDFLAPIMLT